MTTCRRRSAAREYSLVMSYQTAQWGEKGDEGGREEGGVVR
jgi:hypothetical protein